MKLTKEQRRLIINNIKKINLYEPFYNINREGDLELYYRYEDLTLSSLYFNIDIYLYAEKKIKDNSEYIEIEIKRLYIDSSNLNENNTFEFKLTEKQKEKIIKEIESNIYLTH